MDHQDYDHYYSTFSRDVIVILMVYILALCLRFHVVLLLSSLINGSHLFNLLFPIALHFLSYLLADDLHQLISRYQGCYDQIAGYLIQNYTPDNLQRWKRYLILVLCGYVLGMTWLVSIDNDSIFLGTLQTIAGFLICELWEVVGSWICARPSRSSIDDGHLHEV